jgi:hypothetical protein
MIYYLAGSPDLEDMERAADKAHANHFLCTFADFAPRKAAQHFCVQPQRRIFVDSGAYSIWTKGAPVTLGEYIEFCKKIKNAAKCPVVFAALDVIPGKKKSTAKPTADEITRACEEGWDNYQTMKQEGIPCLMTFHQYEHRQWLKKIADDSDYFAVAPRKKDEHTADKMVWLKTMVFDYLNIMKSPVNQRKKVHGLGVSSPEFMMAFPFYSVDNTGWIQSVRSYSLASLYGVKTTYRQFKHIEKAAMSGHIFFDTNERLRKTFGFPAPGESSDASRLMYAAMRAAAETEWRVTDFWKRKGLVWPDQELPFDFGSAKQPYRRVHIIAVFPEVRGWEYGFGSFED